MKLNRSFKNFEFRHRNKKNQIIFISKKVENDDIYNYALSRRNRLREEAHMKK